MKLLLGLVGVLVLGAACGVGLVSVELSGNEHFNRFSGKGGEDGTDPQPIAAVVGETTYNFGTSPVHAKGSHVFVIQNLGDAPLTLEEGESTCQCTVGKLSEGTVPPGGSTEVTLEWTPKVYTLEFSHSAEILTNDPNQPKIRLVVEGTVTAETRIEPPRINFGDLPSSLGKTVSFTVYGYHDDHLTLESLKLVDGDDADHFELQQRDLTPAEVEAEPNAKSGVLVTVTIKEGLPLGPVEQTVRLKTDREDTTEQEVSIQGNIVGDISFLPLGAQFNREHNLLVMGLVQSVEGAEATLHLVVKGPHHDEVELSVNKSEIPDSMTVEIGEPRKLGGGKSLLYPISIAIAKDALPVNHTGKKAVKVPIETTHPTVKSINFYVDFAVE